MQRSLTPTSTATSPSDGSTDRNPSSPHHTVKNRKPTYLVRKEEEEALRHEIVQLEAQVATLATQRMSTSEVAETSMHQAQTESNVLHDLVRNQQLGVAAAQSLMLECSRTQSSHPLWSRICLKKDWSERRATLLAIRDDKLQRAYNYNVARCPQPTDGKDRESNEKFETDEGDICFVGNAVIHFPAVESLEKVFDALCFYLNNMEISISERLGHITVREDYDVIEGSAYNARIISSDDYGTSIESNTIVFTQLFREGDPRFGGEPCAIVASDCVDEDEIYPYRALERVRKDISGAIVLTVCIPQCADSTENGNVVVVMRRTGMLKLHHPEFPLSFIAQQELDLGIADWGKVMIKTMREVLYVT